MYSFTGIRAAQILNVIGAYEAEKISFKAARTFLACLEATAANEARMYSIRAHTNITQPVAPVTKSQIEQLLNASCSRELRELERAGLLSIRVGEITLTEILLSFAPQEKRSAARKIPVPREMLRVLITETRPALVLTMISYFLYGLSFERGTGEIKNRGAVKATKVAALTGFSERAIREARAQLISLGWITKDTGSVQRKLNRNGAYFMLNVDWKKEKLSRQEVEKPIEEVCCVASVDNSETACTESAPPKAENCTESAPPLKRLDRFLQNHKDQKETGFLSKNIRKVTLQNIQPEDLKRISVLLVLFGQAVTAGWLNDTEANCLKFVAAAIRANAVGADPVRVFVTIVRRELWHYITQEQEDRAAQALKRCREKQTSAKCSKQVSSLLAGLSSSVSMPPVFAFKAAA